MYGINGQSKHDKDKYLKLNFRLNKKKLKQLYNKLDKTENKLFFKQKNFLLTNQINHTFNPFLFLFHQYFALF